MLYLVKLITPVFVEWNTMNKGQLIQIHRLLALVKENVEEQEQIDDLAALVPEDAYSELNIQPNHIHKSRNDHKDAVQELALLVSEGLEEVEDLPEKHAEQMKGDVEEVTGKPAPFTDYRG